MLTPAGSQGSPYLPVDWVAWDQAAAYCRKLTDLEHKKGRMPRGLRIPAPDRSGVGSTAVCAGSDEDFSVPERLGLVTGSQWLPAARGGRVPAEQVGPV